MNILLIRLRLIGDVVFTTPIIRALRERYPTARLSYLVEAGSAPVLSSNPHLSEVITVAHTRGWRRVLDDLTLGRELRRRRFDLVIDLHGGPRSAWLTWASRAPRRVGYDVPGRSWMYTQVVRRPRTYRARHAVENQWDLLRAVDPALDRAPSPERDRVEMPVDPRVAVTISATLDALGVPAHAGLVVLHVSAGNPFRRWPEESFAALAADLAAAAALRWVLVTAGPSDRQAVHRIIATAHALAGDAAGRIVDAESLSLAELRAVLERASLFVGGDSGPMHVAATSDVPIVTIYGPTLPERSAPWRTRRIPSVAAEPGPLPCRPCDQRVCVPGDFRCLSQVLPVAVRDAALRLLEARS
ncbi:MAG: glycosyltransferase family 9 protein [Acidobacteriota bacterium]